MRILALISLAAALAVPAFAGTPPVKRAPAPPASPEAAYVGVNVPPMPAGVVDEGGFLLPVTSGTTYSIAMVSKGPLRMWWLQRLLGHSADGKPRWAVESVQTIPDSENRHLVYGQCSWRGTPSPAIIAEAEPENAPTLTRIVHAWRIDPADRRFFPLPATEVTCVNESFGIEE